MKRYLIFTDLDGTLLGHENYSYGNNKKLISSIIGKQNEIIIDIKSIVTLKAYQTMWITNY